MTCSCHLTSSCAVAASIKCGWAAAPHLQVRYGAAAQPLPQRGHLHQLPLAGARVKGWADSGDVGLLLSGQERDVEKHIRWSERVERGLDAFEQRGTVNVRTDQTENDRGRVSRLKASSGEIGPHDVRVLRENGKQEGLQPSLILTVLLAKELKPRFDATWRFPAEEV